MARILNFISPPYWRLGTPCFHILSAKTSDAEDSTGLQKSIFHIVSFFLLFIVNDLVLLGLKAN